MARTERFPGVRSILYYVFLVVALTYLFRCLVMMTGAFQVQIHGPGFQFEGAVLVDWSNLRLEIDRKGGGWSLEFSELHVTEFVGFAPDLEDLVLFSCSRSVRDGSWTGFLTCPNWAIVAVAAIPWYLVRVSAYFFTRRKR
ncbi:MAG: hypothetical protein AAGJ79_13920 [Verrucomicrobiota bacterium]